jgi:2,3-bisphosphoglycerate-independent phosphoglycerate mutase
MDRDRRWERVQRWYDVSVRGIGPTAVDPVEAIKSAYERGQTDEFIDPLVITEGTQVTVSSAEDAGQVAPDVRTRPDGTRGTRAGERGKRSSSTAAPVRTP